MKTIALNIENLCVPCHCRCRHCLLSSEHRASGVDYARGEEFASRLINWAKDNRPDLHIMYYIGYCNDFHEVEQYLRFNANVLNVLQFNGLAMRNDEELRNMLRRLHASGMKGFDLTFYGIGPYHDAFAGRKGDFDCLLRLLAEGNREDLDIYAGICMTKENMDQLPALFGILSKYKIKRYFSFLPHAKGRGNALSAQRLTLTDMQQLCSEAKACFSKIEHKPEAQWINERTYPEAYARALTLSLTEENIAQLEEMDPEQILRELEEMDEQYFAQLPDIHTLAREYGDPGNQQMFRFRDMYLQWQKRYLAEHPVCPDMTDERFSFSTRLYHES